MLLLYVTVSCFFFGGSSAEVLNEEVCYGRSLSLPFSYVPVLFKGQMYFTPKSGGSRKLIMDNGKAMDPRLKISYGSIKYTDVTERDDGGIFSVSDTGQPPYNIVRVKLLDCARKITQYYNDRYTFEVPGLAEFLEFTPLHSVDPPTVLWNRTDPQGNKGGRGQKKRNGWEIRHLSQADMGHYNFRAKDNTLVSRMLLEVKEHKRHMKTMVNERLYIAKPSTVTHWSVTFKEHEEDSGTPVNYDYRFSDRVYLSDDDILIDPVEITDAGIYEFTDPQGNLGLTVQVEVEEEPPSTFVYVGIAGGIIFAVIACCCCVRKCCCKKSSSKRDQSEAAPAVYYHDMNQPATPAPDYSYQPTNTLASRETTAISLEPSVYNPVNIHVNPSQPEVAPLGGQAADPAAPSLGSYCLSSDPETTFEMKGLSSTNPLNSDSPFCNVYTSDKLNFL